uniref:Uncharacterized protein n=1 Tax=Anguilla anguilla TaxID=7936 RepID=A0A0E9T8H1_ANGAN
MWWRETYHCVSHLNTMQSCVCPENRTTFMCVSAFCASL